MRIARPLGFGIALLAVAVLVSSCGLVSTTPTDSGALSRLILLAGTPMASCRLGGTPAVCGTLRVPEDRENPTRRSIDLSVMVVPAAAAEPRPDPLFFLAGGPGGAATADFGWAVATFDRLHADRDFVFVDQRGTGGSNRMVVPTLPDVRGLPENEITAMVAATIKELPGDPRFYTTFVAMQDLEAVREALGYEKINLYGPSYGATAAQYYLRRYGDRVRAVVLDGGTLLDVPLFERMPVNSQRALEIQLARCSSDAACRAAYPDLRAKFDAVIAKLRHDPVSTRTVYPYTGAPIVVDHAAFAGLVHEMLADARRLPDLPSVIYAASLGDWETVARAIRGSVPAPGSDTRQLVMSVVIRCSEGWARFDEAEVARLSGGSYGAEPTLAAAKAQAEACRFVPRGVVPQDDVEPVRSAVPTLLILGEADPQDPAANVADADTELPNSRTVIVPGQAHTVGHVGCMPSLIAAFIQSGSAAGLDVSCVVSAGPLPFRTNR